MPATTAGAWGFIRRPQTEQVAGGHRRRRWGAEEEGWRSVKREGRRRRRIQVKELAAFEGDAPVLLTGFVKYHTGRHANLRLSFSSSNLQRFSSSSPAAADVNLICCFHLRSPLSLYSSPFPSSPFSSLFLSSFLSFPFRPALFLYLPSLFLLFFPFPLLPPSLYPFLPSVSCSLPSSILCLSSLLLLLSSLFFPSSASSTLLFSLLSFSASPLFTSFHFIHPSSLSPLFSRVFSPLFLLSFFPLPLLCSPFHFFTLSSVSHFFHLPCLFLLLLPPLLFFSIPFFYSLFFPSICLSILLPSASPVPSFFSSRPIISSPSLSFLLLHLSSPQHI